MCVFICFPPMRNVRLFLFRWPQRPVLTFSLEALASIYDSLLMWILTLNIAILLVSLNFTDYSIDVIQLTNPEML